MYRFTELPIHLFTIYKLRDLTTKSAAALSTLSTHSQAGLRRAVFRDLRLEVPDLERNVCSPYNHTKKLETTAEDRNRLDTRECEIFSRLHGQTTALF